MQEGIAPPIRSPGSPRDVSKKPRSLIELCLLGTHRSGIILLRFSFSHAPKLFLQFRSFACLRATTRPALCRSNARPGAEEQSPPIPLGRSGDHLSSDPVRILRESAFPHANSDADHFPPVAHRHFDCHLHRESYPIPNAFPHPRGFRGKNSHHRIPLHDLS